MCKFSDTVVFWTNDDSDESLKELLEVTYTFNYQAIEFFFPARGTIVYNEIAHVDFRQKNEGGGLYNLNSIFGKGLVEAHIKTEQQNWAGAVIDQSVIEVLLERNFNPIDYLVGYAKKYKIPYKQGVNIYEEEFAFRLTKGTLNKRSFDNVKAAIQRNFSEHKKDINNVGVKLKLENTIKFLETFRDYDD